ncbi:hypothetical protein ABEB36_004809 [Hypothenemus hampei]|uniref:Cytochrome b-c1 complex subunit 8 n=1 Tax=Hypothenemus hampei TaxID=57062 RepID=A0ABD1EW16_HYPHA
MGHKGPRTFFRGMIYYAVSPFYLKPDVVSTYGITNMIRRIKEETFYVCTPLAVAYLIYYFLQKKHAQLNRKNPQDYMNDT